MVEVAQGVRKIILHKIYIISGLIIANGYALNFFRYVYVIKFSF